MRTGSTKASARYKWLGLWRDTERSFEPGRSAVVGIGGAVGAALRALGGARLSASWAGRIRTISP